MVVLVLWLETLYELLISTLVILNFIDLVKKCLLNNLGIYLVSHGVVTHVQ